MTVLVSVAAIVIILTICATLDSLLARRERRTAIWRELTTKSFWRGAFDDVDSTLEEWGDQHRGRQETPSKS